MIEEPLHVSGCQVMQCPHPAAIVMELLADTFPAKSGDVGHRHLIEVVLCAHHADEMDSNKNHAGATFLREPRMRRAVIIGPQLVLSYDPPDDRRSGDGRRRWPTYQELLQAAVDRRVPVR